MKFTENEKKLLQLAFDKAERDGEFTVTSIRLDGTLRKNGAKAYLTVETTGQAEPEKSSSIGSVLFGCFFVFVVIVGTVVSSHKEGEPQHDQTAIEATPSPAAEATPTPGN